MFSINTATAPQIRACSRRPLAVLWRSWSSWSRSACDVTWHVSSCKTPLSGMCSDARGRSGVKSGDSSTQKQGWKKKETITPKQSTWKWSLALISTLSSAAQTTHPSPSPHFPSDSLPGCGCWSQVTQGWRLRWAGGSARSGKRQKPNIANWIRKSEACPPWAEWENEPLKKRRSQNTLWCRWNVNEIEGSGLIKNDPIVLKNPRLV